MFYCIAFSIKTIFNSTNVAGRKVHLINSRVRSPHSAADIC